MTYNKENDMKVLDGVSYALIATTLLAWGLRSGAFFFSPALSFAANGYAPLVFLLLFAGDLALVFVFAFLDRRTPGRRMARAVVASIVIALIVDLYLRFLFATRGSVILGGGRGITGNLSSFWIDWALWFAVAWLVRAALFLKAKLNRHINTSVALFVAAVLVILSFTFF